ncbi:hypothetical protein BYT27DRAFT_7197204 [Phlegmacium glaucopus]|nr:hypothetical protein BYT27DRAFT_7202649 [Phlegmacium glaucopus]KAF8802132.1 hypothetical protein BYT27DRAFT_7197204 [Phlegmacium glaucopus]
MLSKAQEQGLISLCNQFINSGDKIGLSDLLNLVNSTIPDRESQDWKEWTKHMMSSTKLGASSTRRVKIYHGQRFLFIFVILLVANTQLDKPMGNPGDWSINSFLDGE